MCFKVDWMIIEFIWTSSTFVNMYLMYFVHEDRTKSSNTEDIVHIDRSYRLYRNVLSLDKHDYW